MQIIQSMYNWFKYPKIEQIERHEMSVADWPRVPGCDRTLGPPPKKGGPLGQQIQLPMMTYVIDVNHIIVAISCMLS